MAGRRVNLSDLADEPVLPEARVPAVAETTARTAHIDQVAPNPLNTRDLNAHPEKIATIVESMRVHGQLQPCTVVTRNAFLSIFPEHKSTIGSAAFVQVTGGRRRAAAISAGLPALDITVKNQLSESRAIFLSATAAENLDRQDYDPIEEARAVQLVVGECGTGKAAAEQLSRTAAWVTQRLNLLKLVPEVQAAVRVGEMPLREVRTMHTLSESDQMAALVAWQKTRLLAEQLTAGDQQGVPDDGESEPAESAAPKQRTTPRLSPAASAVRRLGGTPPKIADSLRTILSPEDLRTLAQLLLNDA